MILMKYFHQPESDNVENGWKQRNEWRLLIDMSQIIIALIFNIKND